MNDELVELTSEYYGKVIARPKALRILGVAAAGLLFVTSAFGQGHCSDGYETQSCPMTEKPATASIKPVFAPTRWRTVALDHFTFEMPDYRKEAAFYVALMGWKLRSDDGRQAVLDMGDWGSAIFKQIAAPGDLDSYYLYHAARADLLRRLRRNQEALAAYERALSLSANAVERRCLRRRMAELSNV